VLTTRSVDTTNLEGALPPTAVKRVLAAVDDRTEHFDNAYRDLHRHPELSFQEQRTAKIVAESLRASGFEVHTGIGVTGVVGVLRNGAGPTVALRGDMDALPVAENTGLPYASTARGTTQEGEDVAVMHACGHDVHVVCLIAAAEALSRMPGEWSGTLVIIAQPAEELVAGARAMMDDGIYSHTGVPDVVLGQHVGLGPAGTVMHATGRIMGAMAQVDVVVRGRGGHGSLPHLTVDPTVIAAHIVVRLQSIVSREVDPDDPIVITVGKMSAGTKANIIPDEAHLSITVRAQGAARVRWAIERITNVVEAECSASKSPEPARVDVVLLADDLVNDDTVHDRVTAAHRAHFGADSVWRQHELIMASEDFGVLGGHHHLPESIPTHFWFIGGIDPEIWGADAHDRTPTPATLAAPHSPAFAPVIQPTLTVGRDALVSAAMAYLGSETQ
jgi:amidohydrolase